jgi:hypothetical protein
MARRKHYQAVYHTGNSEKTANPSAPTMSRGEQNCQGHDQQTVVKQNREAPIRFAADSSNAAEQTDKCAEAEQKISSGLKPL